MDSLRVQVFAPTSPLMAPNEGHILTAIRTIGSTWLLDFDESTVFQAEPFMTPIRSPAFNCAWWRQHLLLRGAFGESVLYNSDRFWVQETYGGGASYAPGG